MNLKDEEDNEMSCLLDESMLKKQLDMPRVDVPLVDLKKELGAQGNLPLDNLIDPADEAKKQDDDSFYKIVDKDSIEVIDDYTDPCPLLALRKAIMRFRVHVVRISASIISNSVFEGISIFVIVANSFFLALEDPRATGESNFFIMSDYVFQALYTIEMVLKIFGIGFVMGRHAYLRDSWNILDFVIVMSGFASMIFSGGANLSVLRSFRVLRPLRTISGIEGLRIIVSALVSSMPLLRDTILVLLFFFIIFAIAGVQLFQGILKKRCIDIETGIPHPSDEFCGALKCEVGYFCGKTNENPNYGVTNFDNILFALLAIF